MDFPLLRAVALSLISGRFSNGVPGVTPASIIDVVTINSIIDEIIAVQTQGGVTKDETNSTQLKQAIINMIEARVGDYSLDSGVVNAPVVAMNPPVTGYTNGMEVAFRIKYRNTGAVLLNAGGGTRPLVRDDGAALIDGDLPINVLVNAFFDQPSDKFVINSLVTSQALSQTAADARYAGLASIGSFSSQLVVTVGTNFTSANVGTAIVVNAAAATIQNLPLASTVPAGRILNVSNINAGIPSFTRAGSDTITGCNLSGATVLPLNNGENADLVSNGIDKWYVVSSNVAFFGPPRSIKNMIGSRVAGTGYINSSGRNRFVTASGNSVGTAAAMQATVDSVGITGSGTNVASGPVSIFFKVEPGKNYSISPTNVTVTTWTEDD